MILWTGSLNTLLKSKLCWHKNSRLDTWKKKKNIVWDFAGLGLQYEDSPVLKGKSIIKL